MASASPPKFSFSPILSFSPVDLFLSLDADTGHGSAWLGGHRSMRPGGHGRTAAALLLLYLSSLASRRWVTQRRRRRRAQGDGGGRRATAAGAGRGWGPAPPPSSPSSVRAPRCLLLPWQMCFYARRNPRFIKCLGSTGLALRTKSKELPVALPRFGLIRQHGSFCFCTNAVHQAGFLD
ncbi:uncharacterized protein [Miscanthus floridulus]|uniref:uncharacterized protein isoform X3 n=2 Tax=Miscanthus floridulus TaxID=154761 RepID=UPI00345A5EEE